MYRIIGLLWLLGCALPMWAQVPLNHSVQWYPQAGLLQYASIEQAMQAKRHVLHMLAIPNVKRGSAQKAWPKKQSVAIDTCQDYVHYLHRNYVPAGPVDQRVSDEYERICGTLSYVMEAKQAQRNFILPAKLNQLWRELPVQWVFSMSDKDVSQDTVLQRCPDTAVILPSSMSPASHALNPYKVVLHSKRCDRYAQIQLLAQGDISQDGAQDVLIDLYRWSADAKYQGQHVLVVSKMGPQAPVKVMPWRAKFQARKLGSP
jgi:hypothetical protein